MAQKKAKARLNELSELVSAPIIKLKLIYQSISKPLGSDPDQHVLDRMTPEQRAELKERELNESKKQTKDKQVQPKPAEPAETIWAIGSNDGGNVSLNSVGDRHIDKAAQRIIKDFAAHRASNREANRIYSRY
jgi:hypothetical protein